ncbi:MAG TPA: DUF835 domain-containing protein [Candidatus Bathyarchaeia archaeon]|nr:DUF835 domain-containing protein [Candidatus Bathyarchaeia archaeon]
MEGISPRILTIYEAITEICSRAIANVDREAAFQQICNTFVERAIYTATSIGIVDKGAIKVRIIAQAGLDDFPTEFPLSDLLEIQQKSPYLCNNLSCFGDGNVLGAKASSRGFQSMAIFPIKIANNIAAVFSLYSREADAFSADEMAIVEKLQEVISGIIVRSKLETQKLHAQMELQRSEAIFSHVAERIVGMICEIDEHGVITFVSSSQRRVLGFESESIVGKQLMGLVHPQFIDTFEETLKKCRQSHCSELIEVRMKTVHGQYVWVELVSDPVEDEEKHVSAFVVAIRDITAIKDQIEKLQNQVNELDDRVKDRTEKLRTLKVVSSQRIRTAIGQINHISEIRDRLSKNPGVKSGFNLVLKSAMRALAMDAGGIFVLNAMDKAVEARAIVPGKNSTVRSTYGLDDRFLEFESIYRKEPVSKVDSDGRSLLGTHTIHCAPISLGNNVRGFLALGSNAPRVLDEGDLTILKLYSAVAADLLKSTSLNVEPTKEIVRSVERGCRLDRGNAYLVLDNVGLAYELFLEAIMSGIEGLCITRTMPARIREKHNLQRTPIIWLTEETVDGEKTIHNLQDVSILISNYVQKATNPVILIDGIEYLISHKGFGSVYHLLQSKRTQMEANQGILIIPIFRDAMEAKEAKLLERELRVFGATTDAYNTKEDLTGLVNV